MNRIAKKIESSKGLKLQLMMTSENKTPVVSQNVIGMLEKADPVLKNEYIIYSAHYDHLGIEKLDATGDRMYNVLV